MKNSCNPLIGIITVNKNDEKGLYRTIQSVRAQTYGNLSLYIVDGKSSDGSLTVIKDSSDVVTSYISEEDSGLYDAMNKGTRMAAECDYIIYLNSGDTFASHSTLVFVCSFISGNNSRSDIIYGDTILRNSNEEIVRLSKAKHIVYLRHNMHTHHQSIFFKRKILGDSPYDTDRFHSAADYALMVQLYTSGCNFSYLPIPISCFSMGGRSYSNDFQKIGYREHKIIKQAYLGLGQNVTEFHIFLLRVINFCRSHSSLNLSRIHRFLQLSNRVKTLVLFKCTKAFITALEGPNLALQGSWIGCEHRNVLKSIGKIRNIVDVGCSKGQFIMACQRYIEFERIIAYDPIPSNHKILASFKERTKETCKIEFSTHILSSSQKKVIFNITSSDACSSYLAPSITEYYQKEKEVIDSFLVQATTLDNDLQQYLIEGDILLKIDTQGSELDILKGSRRILFEGNVKYIYVELSDIIHYQSQPCAGEVISFLLDLGYCIKDFYNINISSTGHLIYCDVLFVQAK